MNKIIINVVGDINRFFDKCINHNISISDIKHISGREITASIYLEDFKRLKRACYFCKIKIIKYEGFIGLEKHIKKNIYVYILFLWCFILMDILSSFIVSVEVIHENYDIRSLVSSELNFHGIKKYQLAYSFGEIERIKNDILKDNPNNLEWMSITRVGMKYIIRVEERIIKEEKADNTPCNIIAKKDALITKIVSSKGEVIVRSNEYVKKGDVLISGELKLYDEVKAFVHAEGIVYGNVWYEATVKIPLYEERKVDTGKSRYNISFNNRVLLNDKYHLFRKEDVKELRLLGLNIQLYKEVEYAKDSHKLTNEEINNLLSAKIKESFSKKLKNNGEVISQKVLKKEEKNSTIEYRVFVITNEIISEYKNIEMSDENDSRKST